MQVDVNSGGVPLNILQTLFQAVAKPFGPIHCGEAFGLWGTYEGLAESRAIMETLLNHAGDQELRETLEHFIADVLEPEMQKLSAKLLQEGMAVPEATSDKPKADRQQIPLGALFSDQQVANMMVLKIQGLLTFCSQGLSTSLRDDMAAMYYTLQGHLLAQGATLKALMTARGWLRMPPAYPPSAEAHQ